MYIYTLRAAGARTEVLARTGINPAGLFGVGVTGASSTDLQQIRSICRSAFRPYTKGRSLTLDLALAGTGTDPAYRAHMEPVQFLCQALWDDWVPRSCILRTLSGAAMRIEQLTNPWAGIKGPASAVVATIRRLGWEIARHKPTQWRTHVGDIDIDVLPPRAVCNIVKDAVELWLWRREVANHPELA